MNSIQQHLAEGFLFTDMYQFTMAQLYFRQGMHEKVVQFNHFFRSYPDYGNHKAGYCINAGLGWLLPWIRESRITIEELEVLKEQKDSKGKQLFDNDFLKWLKENGNFEALNIYAVPEGRVIHPHTPITVVEGPLAIAQILETTLLSHLNYQILIATKAARIKEIAGSGLVLEFGARRAHDKGANAGARAALIGGADFTSNVGISHILGYPPKGTHAHSMVQAFMALGLSELDAFRAYAENYPDDCLLLVDTVNTLESGVPNAIKVFEELRQKGHKPLGIRLDSGDLAYLSIQAAKMLDKTGFEDTTIVLSNDLDELVILQIITQIRQEAPNYQLDSDKLIQRLAYGVGTRLITSQGDSALGGVYKLVAMQNNGNWQPVLKISNSAEKIPTPGNKLLWRLYDKRGYATADLISLAAETPQRDVFNEPIHSVDLSKEREVNPNSLSTIEPLLVDVIKEGKQIYEVPTIEAMRQKRQEDLVKLDSGVRRVVNPHIYHVSLTHKLWKLKQDLIRSGLKQR